MLGCLVVRLCRAIAAGEPPPDDRLEGLLLEAAKARKACGPVAAWYCLKRLGHDVRAADVLEQLPAGAEGTTLRAVYEVCRSHDRSACAVACNRDDLGRLPAPAILVVGSTHCVVFDGLEEEGQVVVFFEPASRETWRLPVAEFRKLWSGEAIVFGPPRPSAVGQGALALLVLFVTFGLGVGVLRFWPSWRGFGSAAAAASSEDPTPAGEEGGVDTQEKAAHDGVGHD